MGSRRQAYDDNYRDSGYSGEYNMDILVLLRICNNFKFLLGRSNNYDESSRRYDDDDDDRNYYSDDGMLLLPRC